jgi:tetratricopeptide (TPR) repeat protein
MLGGAAQQNRFLSESSKALSARKYYGRLLEEYPKFPMKAEVEYEMARELLRLGKNEEAIKQLKEVVSKHSDLLLFRGFQGVDFSKITSIDNLSPHYPQ